jgi:hypothetical protein
LTKGVLIQIKDKVLKEGALVLDQNREKAKDHIHQKGVKKGNILIKEVIGQMTEKVRLLFLKSQRQLYLNQEKI